MHGIAQPELTSKRRCSHERAAAQSFSTVFFDTLSWDETKQTLCLNFAGLSYSNTKSGWNVMVQARTIGWFLVTTLRERCIRSL